MVKPAWHGTTSRSPLGEEMAEGQGIEDDDVPRERKEGQFFPVREEGKHSSRQMSDSSLVEMHARKGWA